MNSNTINLKPGASFLAANPNPLSSELMRRSFTNQYKPEDINGIICAQTSQPKDSKFGDPLTRL